MMGWNREKEQVPGVWCIRVWGRFFSGNVREGWFVVQKRTLE